MFRVYNCEMRAKRVEEITAGSVKMQLEKLVRHNKENIVELMRILYKSF